MNFYPKPYEPVRSLASHKRHAGLVFRSCRAGILLSLFILVFSCFSAGAIPSLSDTAYLRVKLEKAETYFRSIPNEQVEVDVRVLLPGLEQHFHRSIWPKTWQRDSLALPRAYRAIWLYEKRGAFLPKLPKNEVDSLYHDLYTSYGDNRTDAFTLFSCLCRETGLPDDFFLQLDQRSGWGPYELTHAALQYRNLFLDGCIPESQFLQARSRLEPELIKILKNNDLDDDVCIEAAVMLHYLECPSVSDEPVQQRIIALLEKQSIQGGWARREGDYLSQHTTLLATWILLEVRENALNK